MDHREYRLWNADRLGAPVTMRCALFSPTSTQKEEYKMYHSHNNVLFVILCSLAGLFVLYTTVKDCAILSRTRELLHFNFTKAKKGDRHE